MIRQATVEDKPALTAMALNFMASTAYGQLLRPAEGMLDRLIDLVLENGAIFIAEVNSVQFASGRNQPIGMLAVVVVPHPVTGEDFVDEVAWWVEPAYRNATVGPRLLHHMEGWACMKGLHMVKMVAPADAPDVGEFYRRSGYMAVETAWLKVLKT